MLNQSKKDWILTVIHDGPNKEFDQIMESYKKILPNNINFENTSILCVLCNLYIFYVII